MPRSRTTSSGRSLRYSVQVVPSKTPESWPSAHTSAASSAPASSSTAEPGVPRQTTLPTRRVGWAGRSGSPKPPRPAGPVPPGIERRASRSSSSGRRTRPSTRSRHVVAGTCAIPKCPITYRSSTAVTAAPRASGGRCRFTAPAGDITVPGGRPGPSVVSPSTLEGLPGHVRCPEHPGPVTDDRSSPPDGREEEEAAARRAVVRQGLSVAAATGLYGASFGALGVTSGLSVLQTCLLSLLLFSGGSPFALVGILGGGGTVAAAVAASSLLGVRNALYGLQLVPTMQPAGGRRFAMAHVTIDESTAVAVSQSTPPLRRLGFWVTGLGVFVGWNLMTLAGALAGSALGDPKRFRAR